MKVRSQQVRTWKQFVAIAESLREEHWAYRGVRNEKRANLKPSLERCREEYQIPGKAMLYVEGGLIRRFKRNYYHYSPDAPSFEDYIEWLALMRHHGAPTRLLDWTYSIFIALFFALERSETPAVVWALNIGYLDEVLKHERFGDLYETLDRSRNVRTLGEFKTTFGREDPPLTFVAPLNPYRLNQRLTVQQGTFLAQGNLELTFEQNLEAMIGKTPADSIARRVVISNDREFRKELQRRLYRMGISRAALFPGLDGFAHSLEQFLNFSMRMTPPDSGYASNFAPPPLR